VLIAGVQHGTMPLVLGPGELPDEAATRDHEERERLLLFVAATRARDELVITGFGKPSPFVVSAPAR
jgi:superfamily I DNA/RNA helicase